MLQFFNQSLWFIFIILLPIIHRKYLIYEIVNVQSIGTMCLLFMCRYVQSIGTMCLLFMCRFMVHFPFQNYKVDAALLCNKYE